MTARLATTRDALVVVGGLSLLLSWTTWVNYTTDELPTRDLCVLALAVSGMVGVLCAFVPVNAVTRGVSGVGLMVCAVLRIAGFSIETLRRTDGVVGFIEGTNAVWVWAIVGYFGYLLWARRHQGGERRGANDAP